MADDKPTPPPEPEPERPRPITPDPMTPMTHGYEGGDTKTMDRPYDGETRGR